MDSLLDMHMSAKEKTIDPGGFPTTLWTQILKASETNATPAQRQQCTEMLATNYWPPIYKFIRRRGYDRESAEDLTQAFFAVFFEKCYFEDAERRRGKFRAFLLKAVKNFLCN